jgi:hypothetical protein
VAQGTAAQGLCGRLEGPRVGEHELQALVGDPPLELGRGALGHDAPAVEDGDAVGEDVGLLWGRALGRLTDPERFPALHEALGSVAFAQDDDPDDEFVFGSSACWTGSTRWPGVASGDGPKGPG